MSADLSLVAPVLDAAFFRDLEARLQRQEKGLAVSGLVAGARGLLLALLAERTRRRFLVVVPDDASLDPWRRDLAAAASILGTDPKGVAVLPALDADPYDDIAPHPEVSRERVTTLVRMARRDARIVLVASRALLSVLPAPEAVAAATRVVRPGDALPPDRFVLEALRAGYRRTDTVSAPGEISRRGGIVDIFPPDADEPVRIELFGDVVESLRSFDTDHQRSTKPLSSATIGPMSENPASDDAVRRLEAYLEDGARRARAGDGPVQAIRQRLDRLRAEGFLPGFEALAALTAERPTTVFEHAEGAAIVVDEPERAAEEVARAAREIRDSYEASGDRVLPPPEALFGNPVEVVRRLRDADLALRELAEETTERPAVTHVVSSRPPRSWAGRLGEMAAELAAAREHGVRTVCVMRAPGTARRLAEILAEYRLPAALSLGGEPLPADAWKPGGIFVVVGGLTRGFELPDQALVLLSEREVFGEEAKAAERKSRGREAFVSDFRDLKVGDLVVHVDHGVARYAGLGRPKGGSLNRDFMVLEFAAGDRLFVPVDRLDLVQKHAGAGGARPALDKLGGPTWARVKARVRKSVESMARELLDLYARRRAARRPAFSPDTGWQREMEEAFPFELTPDQERAVAEVKRDMESDRPMDRLLVGDVGFGKTEVAVRAAFKAVMDGQQAAVLAPTTVLAAQHFRTFRERYAPFPVRVEMVSRFRSASEVRGVLRGLATGEVDVVVGTHRLLSRDVAFRKLGLLVVDEEQRFGVTAKERLKKLSVGVDILAMTATPIPRTLQISLAGVRDLSIIETPPIGRNAIQTYLLPFRTNVLAQAIRQEVRRGGQIFFVHNRVETLPSLARALREMVPEARIAVGHGQMNEHDLERVMLRFVEREADVLLTTTIIENGLDIPRANTIIVNRADRFGLAQLYQLRGRVGRSDQRAYAYFLIPGRQAISEAARKRLKALQEFSDLGSGFRLAAADLEIRGAGEFLGARQHGHIAALGFDLYCQMLERAVADLRGEAVEEAPPAVLHLGVDIKIPEGFMPEVGDRLALYKRVSAARTEVDLDRLQADTEDRYGHLPPAGRNLFDLARVRIVAGAAAVRSADVADSMIQIRFHGAPPADPARLVELVARQRGRLTPSGMLVLPAPERASDRIGALREILRQIVGLPVA